MFPVLIDSFPPLFISTVWEPVWELRGCVIYIKYTDRVFPFLSWSSV
uniref:Uncharacterized protein n=1 Tax=Anguilla anguilla TaxID=7936 RepID=A0A0E9QR13_ANGAN